MMKGERRFAKAAPDKLDETDKSCNYVYLWTDRAADFDQDGTIDLDLSTQEKCEKAPYIGIWRGPPQNRCYQAGFPVPILQKPPPIQQWVPDANDEDRDGKAIFSAPGEFLVLLKKAEQAPARILWYDAPHLTYNERAGSTYRGRFVAIVRGSDAPFKYCYDLFQVDYKRNDVGVMDQEDLKEIKKECDVTVDKVPGLVVPAKP